MSDFIDEETYLREAIAMLHESYTKAAKPYIDRLVAIESMKTRPPIFVMYEQAKAFGIMLNDETGSK